jgi:poly-gamma-glutamate synthesis protein (capsule biosynthesis protein)
MLFLHKKYDKKKAMIRVSISGDFKAISPEKIVVSEELQAFFKNNAINVINFEAPVMTDSPAIEKSGPSLFQSENSPSFLESLGFNLVSLANNHTLDYGVDALYNTIESFQEAQTMGAGNWADAYKMKIFTVGDRKIGFMGLTHCEFGTLTDQWDRKNNIGCAWVNHNCVDELIVNCKQEVDALIVFVHAGVEYVDFPLPEWRDRYRQLIKDGADAVLASHPHVPQGWEEYDGKPVFYSLGNFCFQKENDIYPPYWNNSLCVLLEFDSNMNLSYRVNNIKYDAFKIDFCNDEEINEHIKTCLSYLSDDSFYLSEVNKAVIRLLPHYYNLFKLGTNSIKCDGSFKSFLRFVKRTLFCKEEPSQLINILRCESHRWCFQRALKNVHHLT